MAAIQIDDAKIAKRPFYGWFIVSVAFLAFFVGAGVSSDALTVLLKPMSQGLGGTRTAVIGATTVAAAVSAAVSPLIGRVVDKHGARVLMAASAAVAGGLLMAISLVSSLWQFYLLFGVGIGLTRPGAAFVSATTAVSNWFIRKRGRALALSSMGTGVSALLIIPATQYIVTGFHWRAAWAMLGVMMWVLVALPAVFLIRRSPEDIGLMPDGEPAGNKQAVVAPRAASEPKGRGSQAEVNWDRRAALRTRAFWLVLVTIGLAHLPIMGIWLHSISNFTDKGITAAGSAFALSSVALASLPFRLFWGLLAERLSVRACIIMVNLGSGVAAILIMLATSLPTAIGAMLCWGVFVGGSMVLHDLVWPDYFGRRALGSIRGYAQLFLVAGTAGGPLLAGLIYDVAGSYGLAFGIFIAAYLLAGLTMFFAKRPVPLQTYVG